MRISKFLFFWIVGGRSLAEDDGGYYCYLVFFNVMYRLEGSDKLGLAEKAKIG